MQYAPWNLCNRISLHHLIRGSERQERKAYPTDLAVLTSHMCAAANHGFFPSLLNLSSSGLYASGTGFEAPPVSAQQVLGGHIHPGLPKVIPHTRNISSREAPHRIPHPGASAHTRPRRAAGKASSTRPRARRRPPRCRTPPGPPLPRRRACGGRGRRRPRRRACTGPTMTGTFTRARRPRSSRRRGAGA